MKQKWEKPSMLVIVRNKPEEAVLAGCKTISSISGSPIVEATGCRKSTCPICEEMATT